MKDLLKFFAKYYFIFQFVLFEIIGILLLAYNNTYHKAQLVNFTQNLVNGISSHSANIKDYLSLREENRQLIEENNRLYNQLRSSFRYTIPEDLSLADSTASRQYLYINAEVINNSVNKQYNYITLDKGEKNGIERDMPVICYNGVVGRIKEVSANYSSVMSLLNRDFQISAKIKHNEYIYPGPLTWTGNGYQKAYLEDIPYHVEFEIGDTIITSGYSEHYPEGILIGIISDYAIKGGNFYEITVDLSTDFKNLNNVQVIKDFYKEEQIELENRAQND